MDSLYISALSMQQNIDYWARTGRIVEWDEDAEKAC